MSAADFPGAKASPSRTQTAMKLRSQKVNVEVIDVSGDDEDPLYASQFSQAEETDTFETVKARAIKSPTALVQEEKGKEETEKRSAAVRLASAQATILRPFQFLAEKTQTATATLQPLESVLDSNEWKGAMTKIQERLEQIRQVCNSNKKTSSEAAQHAMSTLTAFRDKCEELIIAIDFGLGFSAPEVTSPTMSMGSTCSSPMSPCLIAPRPSRASSFGSSSSSTTSVATSSWPTSMFMEDSRF